MKLSPFQPIGEWKPDLSDYSNDGLLVCKNAIPDSGRYKPFPDILVYSTAATARVQGALAYQHTDQNAYIFAGDATKLYKLSGATLSDVSRTSGGAYNCDAESQWRFLNYGTRIIATDFNDVPQSFVVGSSTNFAALSADAPKARCMAVVNNFLMFGNVEDVSYSLGAMPDAVWWSAIDDPTNWPQPRTTAARQVQSDYQRLLGTGGQVRAIVGAQNYAVIIQDKNIWRGEYVGPPTIFNFNLAEDNRGTKLGNTVITDGRNTYYLDEDGFYLFDGVQSIPIGANKVDDWFKKDLASNFSYRISVAYDPINHLVMWSYPSTASTDGTCDKIIFFQTVDKVWGLVEKNLEYLVSLLTSGYDLDTDIDSSDIPLDTSAWPSLDSVVYMGGKFKLGAFNTDHKLVYFDGTNLEATFVTGEKQVNEGGRAFVNSVLPICDSSDVVTSIGYRTLQSGAVVYTGESSLQLQTGECNFRVDSPFHRFKFRIPAASDWDYMKGYKIKARSVGEK
jgi:hypothetical protein